MSRQRSLGDGEISPSRGGNADAAKEWISILLPSLTILGVIAAFWMIYQAATLPAPPASDSVTLNASASFASPSAATFPPELVSMAVAISTFIAPTPTWTPPPVTPTAVMTPLPPSLICGPGVAVGTTCEWGDFTPTPEPTLGPCLTPMPGFNCVWLGSRAGTPIATNSDGS